MDRREKWRKREWFRAIEGERETKRRREIGIDRERENAYFIHIITSYREVITFPNRRASVTPRRDPVAHRRRRRTRKPVDARFDPDHGSS